MDVRQTEKPLVKEREELEMVLQHIPKYVFVGSTSRKLGFEVGLECVKESPRWYLNFGTFATLAI